jgi:hypothetical protein
LRRKKFISVLNLLSSGLRRGASLYLPILFVAFLMSCAGLKKSTTTTPPPPQDTTKKDKSDAVKAIDSASAAIEGTVTDINKGIEDVNSTIDNTVSDVTDFLGGFIPGMSKRKDSIMVVPPKPDKGPAVTLDPPTSGGFISTPIERTVTFDSLGNAVLSDDFLGAPTSVPLTQTLDEYLASRMEYNLSDGLTDVAANKPVDFSQNSSTSSGGSDPNSSGGEGFLSDYNSISIPIPPSIVPTIFGKPSINLRVNGDVAIHLAYRDNKFLATSGALFSGSETGLDFRQEVNMSLSGSVGDKIKINTDFASLRQFSFENLFKLSYQGFPDEIIQSIEAGNVSLTTPSKYIGIQSALFGFKMVNRFGPMYLTAVAAQKKGERQTKQFGGGAGSGTGQDYVIQPANYRRNSFFLDTAFIPLYEQYYSTIPPNSNLPDVVINGTVQVWRSTTNTNVRNADVYAWYTLPPTPAGSDYPDVYRPSPLPNLPKDQLSTSYMEMLDTTQYRIDYKTGVLILYQEPSDQQIIAVSYKTPTGQIGEQTSGKDKYVLKLVKPKDVFQNPSITPWKNILKNTYYVGATNVDETGFSARILYTFPTGQIYEYVRAAEGQDRTISVTGLDRYNNSNPGVRAPDGAVDMIPSNTILDRRNGTLTFPFLEPFGQRILNYHKEQERKNRNYKKDSTFYFPELYTNSQEYLRINLTKNSNISINVKYAGGTSSSLQLNAFNIVEGSVRVTAGGRQLQEGVDYRVDINSGTVTLLRPDIASLGAISVDYDQHDFFTTNTKTLLGLRAELPILNRGGLGFSLMSYSMGVQSLKTRQGEEPFWNWVLGADATYSVPTNSLTNMLNALPFFNLKDKSEITAKLDFALSLPNPNTQTSPMPIDNNKSIAYVDDFESGKTNTPLGMTYGRWVHATQPDSVQKYFGLNQIEVNRRKSKMWWYEKAVQDVLITDIKPNRSTSRPNETAQVLDVVYDPANLAAIYNPTPASFSEPTATLEDRWAGMMQWSPGLNVIANNTEAIEFWVNTNGLASGFIHFDMGRISEDVIPDGVRETEDKNNNGRYDPGEDVGLDTIINQTEQDSIQGATNPNDPDNDNYSYNRDTDPNNYDNINGTEGNQNDRAAGFKPDNEDLDGNSSLDLDNSYFQYDIPLDPNNNPYIVGRSKGWVQYRIPINQYTKTVGNPSRTFSNIEYYRIWLTGFNSRVHLQFHEINLVGSQWSKVKPLGTNGLPYEDTTSGFEVNYVNIEENAGSPAFYEPPPGAERDRIAGQSVLVYGNEQSINLSVSCLPTGQQRGAVRVFPAPNDLFNYRSIAVWAHGDSAARESVTSIPDTLNTIWVVFRIGSDRYNFYEYRRPLIRGWQNMVMDFGTLSSLKATKLKYEDIVTQPANDGVFGSTYRVVGSPTVTNAPYLALGIENQTLDDCLKTDVWFDELRLLEGNDQADYAMNGLVQAKLAEFGTVSATFLNERADFHRIDERFSLTRSRNYGWALTGEFGMQKVLPSWLERGTVFPLTLSHSESIITPKYIPNTDIEIEAAAESIQRSADAGLIPQAVAQQRIDSIRTTNETLTVRNSIAATGVKFTFPGSFFMLPLFVNQLKYGFGFGEEFNRSYQYEYNRSWAWTASIFYELNNIPKANVSLLKWIPAETFSVGRYSNYSINFLPMRFSTGLSMTRGRKHWIDRTSTLQYPVNADATDSMLVQQSRKATINRAFTADRGLGFTWKLTENGILSPQIDYNLQVTSNMGYLETDAVPNQANNSYDSVYFYQREFSKILGDVFFTNGAIAKLGEDYLTIQRFKLSTSPRLPWLFWVDRYLRPIFTYNVDYRWINSQTGLQNAKTSSWNNVISTGVEINLRPLGLDIFGSDQAPKRPGAGTAVTDPNTPPDGSFDGDTRVAGRPRVRRIGDAGVTNAPMMLDTMMKGSPQISAELDTGKTKKSDIGTGGERTDYSMSDTVLTPMAPVETTPSVVRVPETETDLGDIAEAIVHKPFFDWNGTRFNFTQTNYSLNGALQGSGSGITNFFTGNIFRKENDANGPSQAYQLGLITDPHGRLLFKFKPQFPFISFEVRHGDRAPSPSQRSIDITDVFTQKNTFDLSTSRPLWPGAQISLNWKTEFTYDERNSLRIDQFGKITELSVTKIGDVNRTFLSIPTLPFLSIRQSGIIKVGEKWEEKSSAAGYTTNGARDSMPQALRNDLQAESFLEGFETLPLFSGALREFLPRLNYSFSWSGLEKLPIFMFVDRVSLRHAYSGNYRRTHRLDPNETDELTTLQTVTYGFRPLVAFDMNWDKILGGRMTGTLNYDTQTEWAADYSSNRITRRFSSTFGININYQKEGLKIPFFNLNLKNTFGASLLVSQTVASDIFYQFNTITSNPDGTGNGGITKITIEPRFSYDLSQKLTIEGFYRYERTIPATTGLLIPPTRLILAGFDIRLKIF